MKLFPLRRAGSAALSILIAAGPASAQTIRGGSSVSAAGSASAAVPAVSLGAVSLGAASFGAPSIMTLAPALSPSFGLTPAPAAPLAALAPTVSAAAKSARGPVGVPPAAKTPTEKSIILLQVMPDSEGRSRLTGRDQSKAIEALAARSEGTVRILKTERGTSLFDLNFAVEVEVSAREKVLGELRAIEGLASHTLAEVVDAGARRDAPGPLNEAGLAALKQRIEKGALPDRLRAFSELAATLESSPAGQATTLAESLRDEAFGEVHSLAGFLVNSYNLVRGDARQILREQEHEARGDEKIDYVAIEKAAHEALKQPAARARFEPLREIFARAVDVIDRLDTPAARSQVLEMLPHADYAGLEQVASRPESKAKYLRTWLDRVTGSVVETLEGMRAGPDRPKEWKDSSRSGGYDHLEGVRRAQYAYLWRPYRSDPGEMRHDLRMLLGMPDPGVADPRAVLDSLGAVRAAIVRALAAVQWMVPEMDALKRENEIGQTMKGRDAYLARMAAQAAEAGSPIDAETLERYRRDLREQVESDYKKIDGHSAVDRLVGSFNYSPYLSFAPGFHEVLYVYSVLRLFSDAHAELNEPGLVKQLTDSAVSFLLSLARAPILKDHPELREEAVDTWKAVSAKAAELKLPLITRLEGVIDPRPQLIPSEPRRLAEKGADYQNIWQAAESPDGRYVARASSDRTILVWEAATGKLVKTIRVEDARQNYGDSANSLGVAWTPEGKLLTAALHDREKGGGYQMVRTFTMAGRKKNLLPKDALSEAVLPDVRVLRHMPQSRTGQYLAAEIWRQSTDGAYKGSEVQLFAMDGRPLAQIADATLLDIRGGLVLTGANLRAEPELELRDLADPAQPREATPAWLRDWTSAWKVRNPRSEGEYPRWPLLTARLGNRQGRPALVVQDGGALEMFDLETGAKLSSLEIPNRWKASLTASDAAGRFLAAVVSPVFSGEATFSGGIPDRVLVWDLSTGEIVMEREAAKVSELLLGRDGKRLITASKQGVEIVDLP